MDKQRKLNPKKLSPPNAVAGRLIAADKKRIQSNKIIWFVKTFFGEGF